jgi:hypothetical protein
VDFIQKHQLHFNDNTQQLSFLQTPSKVIFTIKNFTLPPFATTMVQARSFQTIHEDQTYIAVICIPKHPLIAGASVLVTFDEINHCAIYKTAHHTKLASKKET